jgi:hypothetical protein
MFSSRAKEFFEAKKSKIANYEYFLSSTGCPTFPYKKRVGKK